MSAWCEAAWEEVVGYLATIYMTSIMHGISHVQCLIWSTSTYMYQVALGTFVLSAASCKQEQRHA